MFYHVNLAYYQIAMCDLSHMMSMIDLATISVETLIDRDREVVNCTRSHVKTNSELTNLMKISRIEGYNGKYGSNP